jgi:hypothetical protein
VPALISIEAKNLSALDPDPVLYGFYSLVFRYFLVTVGLLRNLILVLLQLFISLLASHAAGAPRGYQALPEARQRKVSVACAVDGDLAATRATWSDSHPAYARAALCCLMQ